MSYPGIRRMEGLAAGESELWVPWCSVTSPNPKCEVQRQVEGRGCAESSGRGTDPSSLRTSWGGAGGRRGELEQGSKDKEKTGTFLSKGISNFTLFPLPCISYMFSLRK